MKTLIKFSFFILISTIIVAGCDTPKKLLQKGNYYQATMSAIQKLRSNPNNANAQMVVVQAYSLAVETAKRSINNASLRNDLNKHDVIIANYVNLNNLANQIYTCPKALELIPYPQQFVAELEQAKINAAQQYYNQGIIALRNNTIEQARLAYTYFTKANNYVYGYRDVFEKIEDARFAATLHVIVLPPQTPMRFQISAEFFYNNLISEMSRNSQRQFVRFYTPQEASSTGLRNPDQYIVFDFVDFTVGNIKESSSTREMKRDSVPVQVSIGGRTQTAYTTVRARFTQYTREVISGGKMSVRIMDGNQRLIEQRAFNGSYTWTSVWGKYTGDDRALTAEQKRMVKQNPQPPPPNQDLFIEFTKPIYTQTVSYIRQFYNR